MYDIDEELVGYFNKQAESVREICSGDRQKLALNSFANTSFRQIKPSQAPLRQCNLDPIL